MTASNDLVARLRAGPLADETDDRPLCDVAADRIEALEAALRDAREYVADEHHWCKTSARFARSSKQEHGWQALRDEAAATLARIDALLGERT